MTTIATDGFDPRDRKRFHFEMTPFRVFLTFTLTRLFRLVMDLRVEGVENFPLEGPVIVAANHVTNFDVFPMQIALPRPIFFMGKAELFRNPVMDVILRNLGAFPVYRGEHDQWAIRHARKVLEHGQTLGMFPEGTRNRGRGLRVAKTGTARLAIEMGCPIVPMAVVGSDRILKTLPRRADVRVTLLPPILPEPGDSPLELTDRLMYAIASALPPEMRGVYAEAAKGFGGQVTSGTH